MTRAIGWLDEHDDPPHPRGGVAAGCSTTPAIRWLHHRGETVRTWIHEAGIGTPGRRRALGIRGLARVHDPIDRAEPAAPRRVAGCASARSCPSIGVPVCGVAAPNPPPTSLAAVRARPNVGRDCQSFRSCRLPGNVHCRSGAWLAFVLRLTAPSRLPQPEPIGVPVCGVAAPNPPPTSLAAVRARPNVGRDCQSFRSCRLPGNVHCRSGAWLAFVLRLTAPSRLPQGEPIGGVDCGIVTPNFAAHQHRCGESATQRGSLLPIVSLMPPAGQRALSVRDLARVRAPIDRAQSAAPGRAHRWGRLRCRRAEFAAHQHRCGESATQRGSRLPIVSLMPPAGQRALSVRGLARVRAPIDRAQSAAPA
jgi:hypothetical protein